MPARGTMAPSRQAAAANDPERLLRLIPDDVRIVTYEWMSYYVDLPDGASAGSYATLQPVEGWQLPSDLRPAGMPDYNLDADTVDCAFLCSSLQFRGILVDNGPDVTVTIQLPVMIAMGARDKSESQFPHYLWRFGAERNGLTGPFEIPYGLAIMCDAKWNLQLSQNARGLGALNFYMTGLQVWYGVPAAKKPD